MVMIQNRELEVLQAKIREAEERLRKARGASGGDGAHQRDGSEGGFPSADTEGEKADDAQSPLSSSVSDSRPSDEGLTDTSASAATSNDMEERLHELQQEHKGKARAS